MCPRTIRAPATCSPIRPAHQLHHLGAHFRRVGPVGTAAVAHDRRRCSLGGTVLGNRIKSVKGGKGWGLSLYRFPPSCVRGSSCAAYGNEFFLYEKMGRRAIGPMESSSEAGSTSEACVHIPLFEQCCSDSYPGPPWGICFPGKKRRNPLWIPSIFDAACVEKAPFRRCAQGF